jgi:hypothetical protein
VSAGGDVLILWRFRISHNMKRGINFLNFDGHAWNDPDYVAGYKQQWASLMWGYFNYPQNPCP